jgi:hypothetical protein
LGKFLIGHLSLADRPDTPGVVSAMGNPEHPTHQAHWILITLSLTKLEFHRFVCEKMAMAFFKMSRSMFLII